LSNKPIAALRYGLNEPGAFGVLPKRLSDRPYAFRNGAFFDKRVLPDPVHQLVLLNKVAAALNEQDKGCKSFWSQLDRPAVVEKHALPRNEAKISKFVCEAVLSHRFS